MEVEAGVFGVVAVVVLVLAVSAEVVVLQVLLHEREALV